MTNEIKVILNYLDMYKNMDEGLLKSKDKKLLLDYITNLQEDNESVRKQNNDLRKIYQNTYKRYIEQGNDEMAGYFMAQIGECRTFYVEPIVDYYELSKQLQEENKYLDDELNNMTDYVKDLQTIEQEHQKLNGELRKENQQLKELTKDKSYCENCEFKKDNVAIKERCEYLQRSCERKEEQMLDYRQEYMEQQDYKSRIDKAIEYINNFSVDKSFSFPLMKRWEENQIKSSIDYEFNDTLKKDLLNILQGEE